MRRTRFGRHREEVLDVILPRGDDVDTAGPIVMYIHGGAHLACRREIFHHALTRLRGAECAYILLSIPLRPRASFLLRCSP